MKSNTLNHYNMVILKIPGNNNESKKLAYEID